MRLWTIHPKYLDTLGLLAVWREGLLAQKVLKGETRGYRAHPQLRRFQACAEPIHAIGTYLLAIFNEAAARSYNFDRLKILSECGSPSIMCTRGQLIYELDHLKAKLKSRDRARYKSALLIERPDAHPLFTIVAGSIEPWEIGAKTSGQTLHNNRRVKAGSVTRRDKRPPA